MNDTLPWWEKTGVSSAQLDSDIEKYSKYDTNAARTYMNTFRNYMAILAVYTSNEHEQTLPLGFSNMETFKFISETFESSEPASGIVVKQPVPTWNTDGKGSPATARQQLLQHVAALKYLCYECQPGKVPLTAEIIKQTHSILMRGAVSEDGIAVNAGQYRTISVHAATGQVYIEPHFIEARVAHYTRQYNAEVAGGLDYISRAANLMYNLVHLVHPFSDGNGRMGRLLVCYALM